MESFSSGAGLDCGVAALSGVLKPKRPAVKAAASWKKFLRELLIDTSEMERAENKYRVLMARKATRTHLEHRRDLG